ncbi:transcriptional regulator [Cytobacillus oceanisediminis]|uniref:Transcriptional regulator n=2 Tax=Cytobacillus oceanisediminis TaxID=665099 RepID=A0A2V3A2T8_9BACI|nr:transcriptional regulator [Cytobacillus oceanisediminis]
MKMDIGQQIRLLRKNQGLSIQEFAKTMNVSVGYLSNLETGKAETIPLSFLKKLQTDFSFFPAEQNGTLNDPFSLRLQQLNKMLITLQESHPEVADYYMNHLERGIPLFMKRQK